MARPKVYDEILRQEMILQTADLLAHGGPDSVSVRAVAQACETSTTAIYTLFGSKDDLVCDVLGAATRGLAEAVVSVPVTDDVVADLTRLGRAYRRWALEHPALYVVMFGPVLAHVPGDLACPEHPIAPIVAAVRRSMDSGLFRRDDVFRVATSIWASLHGMISLEIAGLVGDQDADLAYDRHLLDVACPWLEDAALR